MTKKERLKWVGVVLTLTFFASSLFWMGYRFYYVSKGREVERYFKQTEVDLKIELDAAQSELKSYKEKSFRIAVTEGVVSWYGDWEEKAGNKTANGEVFKSEAYTIAHPTLPFGTIVLVENLENGNLAPAVVNDRGPFVKGRIADMSEGLARRLGFHKKGLMFARIYEIQR